MRVYRKSFDFSIGFWYTDYELRLNFPWNTGPDPLERVGLFFRWVRYENFSFSAIISSRVSRIGSFLSSLLLDMKRTWSRRADDIFPFIIEWKVYRNFMFHDWVERGITTHPFPSLSSTYTGRSKRWFLPHTSFPMFSQRLAYHISFLFGFFIFIRDSIFSLSENHFWKSFLLGCNMTNIIDKIERLYEKFAKNKNILTIILS